METPGKASKEEAVNKASLDSVTATVSIGDPYLKMVVPGEDFINEANCTKMYMDALDQYNRDVGGRYILTDFILKPHPDVFNLRITSWDEHVSGGALFTMQFKSLSPTKSQSIARELWREETNKEGKAPAMPTNPPSSIEGRFSEQDKRFADLESLIVEQGSLIVEQGSQIKALQREKAEAREENERILDSIKTLTRAYTRLQSVLRRKTIYASRDRLRREFKAPVGSTFHKWVQSLTIAKRRHVETSLGGPQLLTVLVGGDEGGNEVAYDVLANELPELAAAVTSLPLSERRTSMLVLFQYAFGKDAEALSIADDDATYYWQVTTEEVRK